jgi:SAM-dependent methyltransferase
MLNDLRRTLWTALPAGEGIDEATRIYAARMHANPFEHYLKRAAALGFRGERMLDAGCGTGTWTFPFTDFFERVDGIDISAPRIALAKALAEQFRTEKAKFAEGDVLRLPYGESAFDLVFCYSVIISYLPARSVFAEFARVLKPGGKLFVVLNGRGWSYYLRDERSKSGERYRLLGCRGIYNDLLRSDRSVTPQEIRARVPALQANPQLARVNKVEQLMTSAEAFLELLAWPELLELSRKIGSECGTEFVRSLVDDVIRIARGTRDSFSHDSAARGYEPSEIAAELAATGFEDFRWAQEERLFGTRGQVFTRGNLFNGLLSTWEFVASKPGVQ